MRKIIKSFWVEPENSSGIVAEAFGIGAGWEKKILTAELELPDTLPPITFITGESGCGKTTLLRELGSLEPIAIPNKPLHSWGHSDEESLRLLSSVGLNDASLFCLRYHELSDSQQARARLYAGLAQGTKTLIVDELFSTLDRATAKALAYSLQKTLRREKIALIAASAHIDIVPYLRPDLLIEGTAFPSHWEVSEPRFGEENPILAKLELLYQADAVTGRTLSATGKSLGYAPGCVTDGKMLYRKCELATLHYKGKYLGGASTYIFATYEGREIGVLVGAKTRHYAKDGGMSIARVVVHPSYRGCGVGKRMIEEFLLRHSTVPVETTAAMARFNPVFERAGMLRVEDSKIIPPSALRKEFSEVSSKDWQSRSFCETFFTSAHNLERLATHADAVAHLFDKGGSKEVYKRTHNGTPMPSEQAARETATAITDKNLGRSVAARLFWRVRPHTMARYIKRPA